VQLLVVLEVNLMECLATNMLEFVESLNKPIF
jgi:hypothetical protein